jgi:3-hydroxyisobutyrate dehydrogenase
MTRLGFIGLGIMGHGMAVNLLASGNPLTVWNRTPEKAVDLVCDVALNPHDLGEAISPSATKDFSTRASELGVTWLDAPVSGGSEGAEQGTLAVMVGGPPATLEAVRPFMEAYSKSIVHVGEEPGSGQMAKAVNQVLVVLNQLAASEALLLAQGAGLDLTMTLEAVEGGAAGSWMLSNRGPQMIRRDWRPGFTIDLQQKDLRLVLEAADELGIPMPGVSLVFQLYRALQAQGLGSEGNHALVKSLEALAGIRLGDRAAPR